MVLRNRILAVAAGLAAVFGSAEAEEEAGSPPEASSRESLRVHWGIELKTHYRSSEAQRLLNPFPFPPDFLPPGQSRGFLETVDSGKSFELSVATLLVEAELGASIAGRLKVDFIDLYDRNPTSSDYQVDVDEAWIRFGSDPERFSGRFGAYLKAGKFGAFERQNDRHLESYGLISTAFNRFEDQGLELGFDLGKHVYFRVSATQGNPLFLRDVNALAGDNGTPERNPRVNPNPDPALKSGFPILYDAEVEHFDIDGKFETGAGLGFRFGDRDAGLFVDLLAWTRERKLAETVKLNGTFYGGDLDLLRGPFNAFSLPIRGNEKREVGGNLWVYWGGFSLFGQYVDQEVAGMKRDGYEGEIAWRFELPLAWAVGGRQLFPAVQPAVRYSFLDPRFEGGAPQFPAPSFRWDWEKIDYGVRLAIVEGTDLTAEYSDQTMTLLNGRKVPLDELLVTLRVRFDSN